MAEFDYRKFLAENKLTKVSRGRETGKAQILSEGLRIQEGFDGSEMDEVSKQKEDYLRRKEREEKGNWKGSVGAFVEKHGEDIAKLKTFKDIDEFLETVMVPELGDEAVEYVRSLRMNSRSPYRFIMSLYNATLKGSGLGLDEASACDECDDWSKAEEVAWEDDDDEYPVKGELDEAVNRTSLGGERNRKKPGVKPGSAGQDKMAKDEMKGEKIDITIGGVTKTVSKQAWSRYRKMTDSEEKKAWKQRHGFTK